MARVAERLEQILQRESPAWGIRPVPPERRDLGGLDLAVLWFDLSVGLLVMVTGALLVPALGLGRAFLAIAVGTLIGASRWRSWRSRASARASRRWCCSGPCSASAGRSCRRR